MTLPYTTSLTEYQQGVTQCTMHVYNTSAFCAAKEATREDAKAARARHPHVITIHGLKRESLQATLIMTGGAAASLISLNDGSPYQGGI